MTLHPQALEAARIDAAFDAFLQLQELPYIPGKDPRDAIRAAIAAYLALQPAEVGELRPAAWMHQSDVERFRGISSAVEMAVIQNVPVLAHGRTDETVFAPLYDATTPLALQAKCNALEGERDAARQSRDYFQDQNDTHGELAERFLIRAEAAEAALSERDATIARLREALEPIRAVTDDYIEHGMDYDESVMCGRVPREGEPIPPVVTFADFRRARAVLTAEAGE